MDMRSDRREAEIIEKTRGIDLKSLGLSQRLFNLLKRNGYDNLTDVMTASSEKLLEMRNFGKASRQELRYLQEFVMLASRGEIIKYCDQNKTLESFKDINIVDKVHYNSTVLEVALNKRIDDIEIVFVNSDGDYCKDISINDISFSVRTSKVLTSYEIDSLGKLSQLTIQELMNFRGMGKKSVDEIIEVLKERAANIEIPFEDNHELDDIIKKIESFFSELFDSSLLDKIENDLRNTVFRIFLDSSSSILFNNDLLLEIVNSNPINHYLREKIFSCVSEKIYFGIERETLVFIASNQKQKYYNIFNIVLNDMISDKQIRIISEKYYIYRIFLNEWINSLPGRYKMIMEYRCSGMTFEEMGEKLGITRERVRQLVVKALNSRPVLYEDDYAEFVKKYKFDKNEISILFDLNEAQVNYLFFTYKRGNGGVQEFLDDTTVPSHFKEHVQTAFSKKLIVLDGECVPLKRDILLQNIIKVFFSDKECSIEELENFYLSFLEENHLSDIKSLIYPSRRALEARVEDYPYTISKAGHKIRFYDLLSVDINDLLEAVEIERYENTEISTLKIIRDWPAVMEQYDIRDEYELHNIIRKKREEINNYNVSIGRMPIIVIGDGDRGKQIEDLLLQMAPIGNYDLAYEYEKKYGVRAGTVLANYFKDIDIYYHDGVFDLEQQDLAEEEYDALRQLLTEEIYLWDDIVKIYQGITKSSRMDAINSMTLKKLGFKVYSGYVIRNDYPSAESFFSNLLQKNCKLHLCELPYGIRSIQSCYSALVGLRDALDLIEVEKDYFYRYDYFAEKFLVRSKEKLIAIGAEVTSRLLDVESEYFSVNALISGNLTEGLPDYIQNVFILNSLIRIQPELKTSRFADTYLGTKKENDLSQNGLITYLVKEAGEISMQDLLDILRTKYFLQLERSRILYVINDSDIIIYDQLFDYICLRSSWDGYNGSVHLAETRFSEIIENNKEDIVRSDVKVASVYWKDKYSEFVDYCAINDCFFMKDMLELDLYKLFETSQESNALCGTISDIMNIYIDWVKGLKAKKHIDEDNNILGLFFK